jgi:hypothetical protein
MKPMAGGAVIGVLVALVIIYLLRPLNAGAIGLVVVICVGVFGALAKLIGQKKP